MAANYFQLTQRKVFVCATDSFVCTLIISLGSSSLFQSNVKNVGVRFDQALSFNTHINSLVWSCILSVKCCPPQSNGVQVRIRNDNSCFCFLKVVIYCTLASGSPFWITYKSLTAKCSYLLGSLVISLDTYFAVFALCIFVIISRAMHGWMPTYLVNCSHIKHAGHWDLWTKTCWWFIFLDWTLKETVCLRLWLLNYGMHHHYSSDFVSVGCNETVKK